MTSQKWIKLKWRTDMAPVVFKLLGHKRRDDFFEARIASQRVPCRIEAELAVAGTGWNFRDDFQLINRQGGLTGPRINQREGTDKVRTDQGILCYRAKFNCTTRLTNRLFFSSQTGIEPRCLRDLNIPFGLAGPFRIHLLSD